MVHNGPAAGVLDSKMKYISKSSPELLGSDALNLECSIAL